MSMSCADPVEVGPVEHDVDGKGKAELSDDGRRCLLVLDRAHPCDAFRHLGVRVLDGDLDVLEADLLEPLGAGSGQAQARGHQRRVQALPPRVRGKLLEVLPQQWLAARQPELQDAERREPG